VNATLPSITPAPGGVEKTSTIERPRLRLLPGALLPTHWLGGGLLHHQPPGRHNARFCCLFGGGIHIGVRAAACQFD